MKKMLAWILASIMVIGGLTAVLAESDTEIEELPLLYRVEPVEDLVGFQPGTEVVIGTATEMAGVFATDMFGNNTADMDVRALLHGYSTVAWIRTLGMALDGVPIAAVETEDLANGGRQYTFTLNNALRYNNGAPLTAKDYVFSILLAISPQIAEIGGMQRDMDHLAGAAAYKSGASAVFSGVRLLGEYTFSLEISPTYLPYFYGLAMLNVTPMPLSVLAPGCDVADDGQGAYIAGLFTAELLRETMLNPETGYVFSPKVTCGPYQLESYDAQTKVAVFTVNPYYLGNFEGQKPHIERITFKPLANPAMADAMVNGGVDIINKVVDPQSYLDLNELVQNAQIGLPHAYPRSGLAYLAFACEAGPTASVAVRNAIARVIDQVAFVEDNLIEGLALPVYGYYGVGQWIVGMPFMEVNTDEGPVMLNGQEAMEMLYLPASMEAAAKLLTDDGWTLNEAGGAYQEGDGMRYRKSGDALEPLMIKWAKIKGNQIADAIRDTIEEPFAQLGIGLEIDEMLLSDMLPYYYRQTDRTYDMFNLASNFTYVFDPYYNYNTAEEYQGLVNASGLKDDRLMALAWNMRRTEARDAQTYIERWYAFQERWVEMMPMVPLYSNVYFDFAAKDVQGYMIESFTSWGLAIPYTYIADEPIVPEQPEDDFWDDDLG